jgi:hypothetical protein
MYWKFRSQSWGNFSNPLSLEQVAREEPYRGSSRINLDFWVSVIDDRARLAQDHLWSLREDPAYFVSSVVERGEHYLTLADVKTQWNGACENLIQEAHIDLVSWQELKTQLGQLSTDSERCFSCQPGSNLKASTINNFSHPKFRTDMFSKVCILPLRYVLSVFAKEVRRRLCHGAFASPGLRAHFWRPEKDVIKSKAAGDDLLLQILFLLEDDDASAKFGVSLLTDELEGLIQKQRSQKKRLTAWTLACFSDIALLAKLEKQVSQQLMYMDCRPAVNGGRSTDEEKKKFLKALSSPEALFAAFRKLRHVFDVEPEIGKIIRPLQREPVSRVDVDTQRRAEQDLDDFWAMIDDCTEGVLSQMISKIIPPTRQLQRTPMYVPQCSNAVSVVSQASEDRFNMPVQRETSRKNEKDENHRPIARRKIKTRGQHLELVEARDLTKKEGQARRTRLP